MKKFALLHFLWKRTFIFQIVVVALIVDSMFFPLLAKQIKPVKQVKPAKPAKVFAFSDVAQIAEQLAKTPFAEPSNKIPQFLKDISYDQWRDIRFKPANSLWRDTPSKFEVQFFHPGKYYELPVQINIIEGGKPQMLPFNKADFDYGRNNFIAQIPDNLGYAGFRLHYPINQPQYKDEIIVFVGASYFRAVGKNQKYGLSARGLAIDTGLDSGEEFPFFKEYWIAKPAPKDDYIIIYSLLDSQSLTGAYAFTIRPGNSTVVNVESKIFSRKKVKKLGIAPLTSMFFYGENVNLRPSDDFRPEIHDSDGVLIKTVNGEWIWRPLVNPPELSFNSFEAPNVAGFGLLQRDLDFDHYQDLEAFYQDRPSVWITPRSQWGNGRVELIQIPTNKEINDNIVAAWVPEQTPDPGQSVAFAYDMEWYQPQKTPHGGGYVTSTRTAHLKEKQERLFIVDFNGGRFSTLDKDIEPVPMVTVGEDKRVKLVEQRIQAIPYTKGWRMTLQLHVEEENVLENVLPPRPAPVQLRAFLKHKDDVLTETWDYDFRP